MQHTARSYRSIIVTLSVIGLVAAGAMAVRAQDGTLSPKGPLPFRNSEPINALFLLPSAASAPTLKSGRSRVDINLDIVNNLLTVEDAAPNRLRRYNVDFEDQRFSFGYARGIGQGQEIGVRVSYIARNGGILDTFINQWHGLFGLQGGGRDTLPDFRTRFQVNNQAGRSVIDTARDTQGLGDTVLEWRQALSSLPDDATGTRRLGVTARALVKLPTGSPTRLLGSGATDLGIGIIGQARPLRNLALHVNVSQVFPGKARISNLDNRRSLTHLLISAEYLLDGRTSLNLQTDDNAAPFRSGIAYPDRPHRALTFGAWRQINGGQAVYLSMAENDAGTLARYAPDYVLSFGTRWRR